MKLHNYGCYSLYDQVDRSRKASTFMHKTIHISFTTAVEDMERNAPTNTPSEALPPHNCKKHPLKITALGMRSCNTVYF